MKISLQLLIISLMFPCAIHSQVETLLQNATEVEEKRYADVQGSPYLWKEWQNGTIYDRDGQIYSVKELNFDGYRHMINIKVNNKCYEIDITNFPKFECSIEGEKRIFQRDTSGNFKFDFIEELYDGSRIYLARTFRVTKNLRRMGSGDGSTEFIQEKFSRNNTYYFIVDGKVIEIEANKKAITAELGFLGPIENVVNSKKLRKNPRAHLIEIAEYFDSL